MAPVSEFVGVWDGHRRENRAGRRKPSEKRTDFWYSSKVTFCDHREQVLAEQISTRVLHSAGKSSQKKWKASYYGGRGRRRKTPVSPDAGARPSALGARRRRGVRCRLQKGAGGCGVSSVDVSHSLSHPSSRPSQTTSAQPLISLPSPPHRHRVRDGLSRERAERRVSQSAGRG
ncbi:hypothetical protein B0H12DRAFT_1148912 [Mycena haematopus]|nr:hypothetical protein B0H12DRAFT_1148912 [Mycena haematopus]